MQRYITKFMKSTVYTLTLWWLMAVCRSFYHAMLWMNGFGSWTFVRRTYIVTETGQPAANIPVPYKRLLPVPLVCSYQQWLVGCPFNINAGQKSPTPPQKLWLKNFIHDALSVRTSGKSSVTTNRKSTTSFPISLRLSTLTENPPKSGSKMGIYYFCKQNSTDVENVCYNIFFEWQSFTLSDIIFWNFGGSKPHND